MSKPKCPATDTEASLRVQVIKKKAAKGRFFINWTPESSENVLLKTPSKRMRLQNFKGGGGANKVYNGWCTNGEFPHLPIFLGSGPLAS